MQDDLRQIIENAKEARMAGRVSEAREAYRRAADLARAGSDQRLLAYALRHVSDLARENGDFNEALMAGSAAVAIYRADPDAAPLDLANALRVHALALADTAPSGQAIALWREARTFYAALGIPEGVAECDAHLPGIP